jgi:hypothetical protein
VNVPLPYERFAIETTLSPEEVAQRLRDVTEPGRLLRIRSERSKEFRGSVNDREFTITRIIRYRNSFLPAVRGRIEPAQDGTCVEVSMRLHGFVLAFMGLWFGLVTVIFVGFIAAVAITQKFTPAVFAPLGFYAFGYALATGAFKVESGRTRERLDALLRTEAPAQAPPPRYWPEDLGVLWSDIRAAGPLGFGWVGCYAVAVPLALYDWIIRHAGCTNRQAHDPRYICPSGAHFFSVWAVSAGMMAITLSGIWPLRRRRLHLLVSVIVVQVIAIVALAWIAQDPAFHVQRR